MILDTNAVSALFAGDPAILPVLRGTTDLHLPLIVCGEYRFGILGSTHAKTLESMLESLERKTRLLTIDIETTAVYARVRAELKSAGTPIPENDVWIAALAVQHQVPVLSRDRHFDRVLSISRISW